MEAKLCLYLMLIILETLTIQGAIPRNERKTASEVVGTRSVCESSCDALMVIGCLFLEFL